MSFTPDNPQSPETTQPDLEPVGGNSGPSKYSRSAAQSRYSRAHQNRSAKRSMSRRTAIAIGAVGVVGVAAAGIGIASFVGSVLGRINSGVTEETKDLLAAQQARAHTLATTALTEEGMELPDDWKDTAPFYMLLLGVDKSLSRTEGDEAELYGNDESNFRSDTIILTRVDPGNRKVTMVSIHRDTYVNIAGEGRKINSAYAFGGVPLIIQTVSEFAGVPISHYAEVDIDGLAAVVDAMGGVEVDVPLEINDPYMGHLDAGHQRLNGWQALILCRSRHAFDDVGDGDRYRAAHQRLFLAAMAQQLFASSPATLVAVINALADYVTTDLTVDQIASLALMLKDMDTSTDIYSTMNPTDAQYIDDTWYEFSRDEEWRALMQIVNSGEKPPVDQDYHSGAGDING